MNASDPIPEGAHSRPEEGSLTVLSLNIRFGRASDGPDNWDSRKHLFPDLLASCRADVYAFQEVNDFQADFLSALLPDHCDIGRRFPAPVFWQNNLIFYPRTWICLDRMHFYLSPTPDIPSRFRKSKWPRQCTLGTFSTGRCRIRCINTHFDFDAEVQRQSAHLIIHRMSELAEADITVLMGDFNAVPGSPCHQVLTRGEGDVRNGFSGFRQVFHPPYPGTHHGFSGRRDGEHIDWILYRGAVSAIRSRVVQESFKGRYPSDHFPLLAMFTTGVSDG